MNSILLGKGGDSRSQVGFTDKIVTWLKGVRMFLYYSHVSSTDIMSGVRGLITTMGWWWNSWLSSRSLLTSPQWRVGVYPHYCQVEVEVQASYMVFIDITGRGNVVGLLLSLGIKVLTPYSAFSDTRLVEGGWSTLLQPGKGRSWGSCLTLVGMGGGGATVFTVMVG